MQAWGSWWGKEERRRNGGECLVPALQAAENGFSAARVLGVAAWAERM